MALLSLAPTAGTQSDLVARLNSVLPEGWFPDAAPILSAVLNGLAAGLAPMFTLLSYTQDQTRIATATDTFLDLVSQDYYGAGLPRAAGEPDGNFRTRIEANLFAPRATRAALAATLAALTGRTPRIFEPRLLADTGAYTIGATLAYNTQGGYGSFALPFQSFVVAYRPAGGGVANSNGYGGSLGGYGAGCAQYTTPAMAASTVLDSAINSAIAATLPVAAIAWTAISN